MEGYLSPVRSTHTAVDSPASKISDQVVRQKPAQVIDASFLVSYNLSLLLLSFKE